MTDSGTLSLSSSSRMVFLAVVTADLPCHQTAMAEKASAPAREESPHLAVVRLKPWRGVDTDRTVSVGESKPLRAATCE